MPTRDKKGEALGFVHPTNINRLMLFLENSCGLDTQQLQEVEHIMADGSAAEITNRRQEEADEGITGDDEFARNEKLRAINPEWFAAVQKRVADDKAKKRMAEDAKQGRARSRFNRRWPNAAKIGAA